MVTDYKCDMCKTHKLEVSQLNDKIDNLIRENRELNNAIIILKECINERIECYSCCEKCTFDSTEEHLRQCTLYRDRVIKLQKVRECKLATR